jgi:hypothetical protein
VPDPVGRQTDPADRAPSGIDESSDPGRIVIEGGLSRTVPVRHIEDGSFPRSKGPLMSERGRYEHDEACGVADRRRLSRSIPILDRRILSGSHGQLSTATMADTYGRP